VDAIGGPLRIGRTWMQRQTDISGGEQLWPLAVYAGLVVVAVAAIMALSHVLGERHRARWRDTPYESGIKPTGSARLRYGLHFYPVGIFFMLFDVEALFLYAYAVAFLELGWAGFIEVTLFIVVLFLGLVYIWRMGGLDWSPTRRRIAARTGGPPPRSGRDRQALDGGAQ
jgi:NADH-quinone oxidoreductase subunit A